MFARAVWNEADVAAVAAVLAETEAIGWVVVVPGRIDEKQTTEITETAATAGTKEVRRETGELAGDGEMFRATVRSMQWSVERAAAAVNFG